MVLALGTAWSRGLTHCILATQHSLFRALEHRYWPAIPEGRQTSPARAPDDVAESADKGARQTPTEVLQSARRIGQLCRQHRFRILPAWPSAPSSLHWNTSGLP